MLLSPAAHATLPDCLQLAEQEPDRARLTASAQLATNPADSTALICRATAEFFAGDFPAAAASFTQAAQLFRQEPETAARLHNKSGWAWLRANNAPAAGRSFAAAIQQAPKTARYWQDHATALMQTEQFWDAKRELDYALQLSPKTAELWAMRAQAWLRLASPANAKSDAQHALALQPEEPLAQAVLQKMATDTE